MRSLANLPLLAIALFASAFVTHTSHAQQTRPFYCDPGSAQSYVVPSGVNELTAVLDGAHGSYPDSGEAGAYGGKVVATFPVSPGQTLYVWVGCLAQNG